MTCSFWNYISLRGSIGISVEKQIWQMYWNQWCQLGQLSDNILLRIWWICEGLERLWLLTPSIYETAWNCWIEKHCESLHQSLGKREEKQSIFFLNTQEIMYFHLIVMEGKSEARFLYIFVSMVSNCRKSNILFKSQNMWLISQI